MRRLLMGIDIGTSACKAAVFDCGGQVVAQSNQSYPVYYPQNGWAEQNPEEWWTAVCKAVKDVLQIVHPSEIRGIGIDGQSWAAIAVDKTGKVLCNTPIWMDTRAGEICEELCAQIGADRIFSLCGNPVQPSYTLPKILWYKKFRPEVYGTAEKILQSNSYIAMKLSGVMTQDLSQGYGLHCIDMRYGRWDFSMLSEMGIAERLLPQIVPCHQIVGRVTKKAALESGLLEGTPVAAGGLDAACGALGAGVLHQGETQEQGGQAGGMSICLDQYHADERLILGYHVVPGRWLLQGGTVGGGGALKWFEEELGGYERKTAEEHGKSSFYELDQTASEIPAGSEGVLFLPYMAGERSPIWNKKAKGVYYGLDYAKKRGHLIRATMEGVAFSLRHNLETAEKAGGEVKELRAMGGAANSRLWTQIKADITGKQILVPASDTATALGSAILAGVGIGMFSSFEEAVGCMVRIQRVQQPNLQNKAVYDRQYQNYLKLYESLRPMMNGED